MKYIILQQEKKQDDLADDIANFFWDAGNEVHIASDCKSNFGSRHQSVYYDCSISIIHKDDPCEFLFEIHQEIFHKYFDINTTENKDTILIFSNKGVYTNTIPYPHKIFNFENLDQHALARFFIWCRKLNLFIGT